MLGVKIFGRPVQALLSKAGPSAIAKAATFANGGAKSFAFNSAVLAGSGLPASYLRQPITSSAVVSCGLTPPDLRASNLKKIDDVSTFKTKGLTNKQIEDYIATDDGRLFLAELASADPLADADKIYARAASQLASFFHEPSAEVISSALVKIVPHGTEVAPHSPFFTTRADLDAAVASGINLSEYFGLPIKSEARTYDVYEISPKSSARVFVGKLAPTEELEGTVKKKGGATQYVVPCRANWNEPKLVGSFANMKEK